MLAPARVVEILLAPSGVEAGGLEMSQSVGADPNFPPCWWDSETAQAFKRLGVLDSAASLIEEDKAPAAAPPAQAGAGAVRSSETASPWRLCSQATRLICLTTPSASERTSSHWRSTAR